MDANQLEEAFVAYINRSIGDNSAEGYWFEPGIPYVANLIEAGIRKELGEAVADLPLRQDVVAAKVSASNRRLDVEWIENENGPALLVSGKKPV